MSKPPTKKQRAQWELIRELGCIVCGNHAAIHHCFTGAGGRKDHDKVIPLCERHHTGVNGIHTLSRKVWEKIYGTERELLERVNKTNEWRKS